MNRLQVDLPPPLYACWPLLTEAAWLLRFDPRAAEKLLQSAALGLYRLLSLNEEDAAAIKRVLRKYRRLKPQLADAALVHLASRENIDTVFTVDRHDFQVYKPASGRAFRTVP